MAPTTRHANDADTIKYRFDHGLVFEASRPDIHLGAEQREFLGHLEHIDDLSAGGGGAERWIGRDTAVRGNHCDSGKRTLGRQKRGAERTSGGTARTWEFERSENTEVNC